MAKRTVQILVIMAVVGVFAFFSGEAKAEQARKSGRVGGRGTDGAEFEGRERAARIIITSVDKDWKSRFERLFLSLVWFYRGAVYGQG